MNARMLEVIARREGSWWVFEIPELGTGGQSPTLAGVDKEAQGVAAMWLDLDPEMVNVTVTTAGHAEQE